VIEDIYNNRYSSPEAIMQDRLEKNLQQFLGNTASRILKTGQDILMEVDQEVLGSVLTEFTDNPEISLKVLKGLSSGGGSGGSSGVNKEAGSIIADITGKNINFSLFLKVRLKSGQINKNQTAVVSLFMQNYKQARIYLTERGPENKLDPGAGTYNQVMGFDGFDIDLSLEDEVINTVFIDTAPARIIRRDFFKDLDIDQLIAYMGRFDYNAGIFGEMVFCQAIEEMLQLEIPKRAKYIRMLMSELFRTVNHLEFISNISNILDYDIARNLALLEKEKILRITEVITGARVIPNYMRIGGVRENIPSDLLKKLKRQLPSMYKKIKRIENALIRDFVLVERATDIGTITKQLAAEYGISGPNLRASGSRYDRRKENEHTGYGDLHFNIPYGRKGDCLERISIRFAEVYQSIKIIGQVLTAIPMGPVIKRINLSHLDLDLSSFTSSVECPHGEMKIFGEMEGRNIQNLAVFGPSKSSLSLAGSLLEGSSFEDTRLIIASLDISSGELMEYYF
jgi:NADH-quinone oxidoreductase subunit D